MVAFEPTELDDDVRLPRVERGSAFFFFELQYNDRPVIIGTYLFILFLVLLLFAFNSVDVVIISADHAHWYAVHCDNYIFDNLDGIDIYSLFYICSTLPF